jgi:hypothetical protein
LAPPFSTDGLVPGPASVHSFRALQIVAARGARPVPIRVSWPNAAGGGRCGIIRRDTDFGRAAMLIDFKLRPLDRVTPWGGLEAPSLHWLALTEGEYWIEAGGRTLFEYAVNRARGPARAIIANITSPACTRIF